MHWRERRRLLDERGPFVIVKTVFDQGRWSPFPEADLTPFDCALGSHRFATWNEAEDFSQELNQAREVLDT